MSKIMLCIETNSSGGAERVIANLANFFVTQNHEVIIVNGDSNSCFYAINNCVKVIKLNIDKTHSNKAYKFILHYKRLKSLFLEHRPDAVIAFLFNMEAPAILAGLITKTKVFTSVRNSASSYSKVVRLFRMIFYPHIAGVVFQSNKVMGCNDFSRVKNKVVIMNPLSNDFPLQLPMISKNDRKKWIISVGRLCEQKNQFMLIKAFKKIICNFPDFELHIFGRGPLKNELKEFIHKESLQDSVFLEGEKSNVIIENRDSYGFVMSSNFEGFPNALVEAMSAGIPSISTDFDSGVAACLIHDGINGFISPVKDELIMAKKLTELLCLSKEEYDAMALKSGKLRYVLSNEVIGKQWEDFLLNRKYGRQKNEGNRQA